MVLSFLSVLSSILRGEGGSSGKNEALAFGSFYWSLPLDGHFERTDENLANETMVTTSGVMHTDRNDKH
jgi:hypothetical protein